MKQIFYILSLFMLFFSISEKGFCSFSENEELIQTAPEQPVLETNIESDDFLSSLYQSARKRITRAQNLKPEDISLVEKPENFDFYTLLSLMHKDAGIFTGNKGLGPEYVFEFGRARLVSCRGNLDNQSVLLTGLLIVLNEDWFLKRPVIPAEKSDLWEREEIFYPLNLKRNASKTDSYQMLTAFPILYHLSDANKTFFVEKEIPLTACKKNRCITETQSYSLKVEAGKGYQTDVCPAVLNAFSVSPQKLPDTIKVAVYQNGTTFIQVNFEFPETVSEVSIQNESHALTIDKKFIQGKKAHLILKSEEPLKSRENIQLDLITSAGVFHWEGVPEYQPFILDTPFFKWSSVFSYGFYFFFFSPLYLLFWSLRRQTEETLKKAFQTVFRYTAIFMIILGGMLYAGVNLDAFFKQPIVLIFQTILLALILYRPFRQLNKWFFPLMLLMPYPFFYSLTLSFPSHAFWETLETILWWGFCALLPFSFTFRHPILFESFSQAEKPIGKIIRFPVLMMFVFMVFSSILVFTQTKNDFSELKLQQALEKGKSVIVSVYQAPCPICTLNQMSMRFIQPTNILFQQNELEQLFLNQNSKEGEAFLKRHHIQKGDSFWLLFGPNVSYGKRIENHYVQPEEWDDYLINLGTIKAFKPDLSF